MYHIILGGKGGKVGIKESIDAVVSFFNGKDTTLRERLLDPLNEEQDTAEPVAEVVIKQPAPEQVPETYEGLEEYELTSLIKDTEDLDLWDGTDYSLETEDQDIAAQEQLAADSEQGYDDDSLGVLVSKEAARREHLEDIKRVENAKGLVRTATDERFMPFDSIEGTGPDSSMSNQEIGHGIKIPKVWFEKDKNKWPVVEGVHIDISKGITKDQEEVMLQNLFDDSFKQASSKLNKWKDMTEMEKVFWADLTYNGGAKAINKNPKAKAAANAGRTVEGMILALDFIKVNHKISRGLLNRRLSRYNQAALEITGAPVIEEYRFGKGAKVKFSSDFITDKVSQKFAKKINNNDGWYVIVKGDVDNSFNHKADDNYKF